MQTIRCLGFVLLIAVSTAQSVQAQLNAGPVSQVVKNANAIAELTGTDIDWDPVHRLHLVAGTCRTSLACSVGLVYGVFVNPVGQAVGSLFPIQGSGSPHSTTLVSSVYLRVKYGAALNSGRGGFLVVWQNVETAASSPIPAPISFNVLTRVVSYDAHSGTLIGQKRSIDSTSTAAGRGRAARLDVAYSSNSQRFLVAYLNPDSWSYGNSVKAILIDTDGARVGLREWVVQNPESPSIAWNSDSDEFGLALVHSGADSLVLLTLAIVNPSTGHVSLNAVASPIAGFAGSPAIAYNRQTHSYVMVWHERNSGHWQIKYAEIGSDGRALSTGLVSNLESLEPNQQALALSFNLTSGTFLVTSTKEPSGLAGVELNARGVRMGPTVNVAEGFTARYVRASAATVQPAPSQGSWVVVFGNTDTINAVALLRSPVPTPVSLCTTVKPGPGWVCVNGDWKPPGKP